MTQVRSGLACLAALALAACGDDAPATPALQESDASPSVSGEVSGPERRILAFGDSLIAGYNLAEDEGYPEQLEVALRNRGINARVVDAGVSGDTTAAGLQRIGFVLDAQQQPVDLAIVELGGNDLLRGLPVEETRANLAGILAELRERGIPTMLMGMRAPPNMGSQYQQAFDALYAELAQEYGAVEGPFFLGAVYDKPALIQPDRVHPTADGIAAIVAATVEEVAKAIPPADSETP